MWRYLWMFFTILTWVSSEYLMGGHLDNNAGIKLQPENIENSSTSSHLYDLDLDLTAEKSTINTTASSISIDDDILRYHIPYSFAFNGGKPFSLEKDPITGKIDLEKAPSVIILNYTSRYYDYKNKESNFEEVGNKEDDNLEQEKNKTKNIDSNEISMYMSNFNDFLNLSINYSSDKHGNNKYPLISNSYANTKVQSGTNSYSMYNHKPYYHENDFYMHPTQNSFPSITNTNIHKTLTMNEKFKTKWKNPTSPFTTTISPIVTTLSKVLSTSTETPIITTWKPSTTLIELYSNSHAVTKEENEKNILPIKKLETYIKSHQNLNISRQIPDDGTMKKIHTNYGNQSNLDNFGLSHAETETKPSMQNEEYRDFYDMYEFSKDEENENDNDNNNNNNDKDANGKKEESNYFVRFQDTLKKHFISILSTNSNIATSTEDSINMITASVGTTSITKVIPSIFPTLFTLQEDTVTNNSLKFSAIMPQYPVVSSSMNNNRMQNITEHHHDIRNHEYISTSTSKSEQNKIETGIVIESTSNIIIPPDKDTISFVLGNHQNVNDDYYLVGTATEKHTDDNILDTSFRPLHNNVYIPVKEIKYEQSSISVTESEISDRIAQKWWPSNSSVLKTNNGFEQTKSKNSFVNSSNAEIENINNQNKNQESFYVIFPNVETKDKNTMTKKNNVIKNEINDSNHELPSKITMIRTTNKTKFNFSMPDISEDLPQLTENLMPPAESSTPLLYYHYQHNTLRSNHSKPQKLPFPSHIKPQPEFLVSPLDIGLRKHPFSPDTKLPNILPQFRPNAKSSYSNRFGSDVIATILDGQNLSIKSRQPLQNHPSLRNSFPPPLSYFQRLNPPPLPTHAVKLTFVSTSKMDNIALPLETKPAIRKFYSPHVSSILHGELKENILLNKLLNHSINQNKSVNDSENKKQDKNKNAILRENQSSKNYQEEPLIIPPRPPLFPKRRTVDPRVTTLQMIQQYGEFGDNEIQLVQSVEPILEHKKKHEQQNNQFDSTEMDEQPIYIVYPVNTAVNIHQDDSNEKDGSVVVGIRGSHRPLPPDTLLQDEQKKNHSIYNGKFMAIDFPYPLERPDPTSIFPTSMKETPLLVPSEQRQQISSIATSKRENNKHKQVAINVIPHLQDFLSHQKKDNSTISVTLQHTTPISTSNMSTLTSTPITHIYTPIQTMMHPTHRLDDDTNVDATTMVLLPSQQPFSSSSSAPASQNFMAPFVASISAETLTKNDWNVIVRPSLEIDKRLNDDNTDAKVTNTEIDIQTEKNEFDTDTFKPQLFGGFQPIFEFPNENIEHHIISDTNIETNSKNLPMPG